MSQFIEKIKTIILKCFYKNIILSLLKEKPVYYVASDDSDEEYSNEKIQRNLFLKRTKNLINLFKKKMRKRKEFFLKLEI